MKVWVGYFSNPSGRAVWLVRRTADAAKRDMEVDDRDGYLWEYREEGGHARWLARLDDGIWAYVEEFEMPDEEETR